MPKLACDPFTSWDEKSVPCEYAFPVCQVIKLKKEGRRTKRLVALNATGIRLWFLQSDSGKTPAANITTISYY
jgi:hypothetical protein